MNTRKVTYGGHPLSEHPNAAKSFLGLLRSDLDRIGRADGAPADAVEVKAALSAADTHLAAAEAALSEYVLTPPFTPGQLVDVLADDGTKVIARGLRVRAVHEWTTDVVDRSGRHDTHLTSTLRASI